MEMCFHTNQVSEAIKNLFISLYLLVYISNITPLASFVFHACPRYLKSGRVLLYTISHFFVSRLIIIHKYNIIAQWFKYQAVYGGQRIIGYAVIAPREQMI